MTKKTSKIPVEKLAHYGKLIAAIPGIDRKGDIHPYTSVNGHLFTYLDRKKLLKPF